MSNEEQLDKADFHYLDYSKGNVAWTIQSYGNEFDGGLMTIYSNYATQQQTTQATSNNY